MGDSLGEGVQSADASWVTQRQAYLVHIARQSRARFSCPWLDSSPLGFVDSTLGRHRIFRRQQARNLAVSGATVGSLLRDRAEATSVQDIVSETEFVLYPRQGSQVEVLSSIPADVVVCWIGNNDVLSSLLSFSALDASQLTPVAEFTDDYRALVAALRSHSDRVVVATIPDITDTAFLMGQAALEAFVVDAPLLPEGAFTTLPTVMLLRIGLVDGSILEDPAFVLDADEVAAIQTHTEALNAVIRSEAAGQGCVLVDMHRTFGEMASAPPVVGGMALDAGYLGGLFSLDGVHPSDTAHALIANEFIAAMNAAWGLGVPLLSKARLARICARDPFVDQDGDGRVPGRPGWGLLETVAPLLGVSGDCDESTVEGPALVGRPVGRAFQDTYVHLRERREAGAPWSRDEAVQAMGKVFVGR